MVSAELERRWLEELLNQLEWKSDELVMFGKRIVTGREVIWFGDDGCDYTYSGVKKSAVTWSEVMLEIKAAVEARVGERFNSCLANLYHHGDEGMGWHSDDEAELGECPTIGAVSLGAERKLKFKHKETKETVDISLGAGSLLLMEGETQQHWQHSVPKTKRSSEPRVSLTFRRIVS